MTEAGAAFVDTNIFVYAFDRSHPEKRKIAGALIERLAETRSLCTSTQVLQEFYNVITRKIQIPLRPQKAILLIDILASWPVFLIDVPAIRQAALLCQKVSVSFWDALIIVAAFRCGASRLYTEDLKHGETYLGLEIVNPFKKE